jgi:hypothetical protein
MLLPSDAISKQNPYQTPSEATGIRSFLHFQKLAAQIKLRPLPFARLTS